MSEQRHSEVEGPRAATFVAAIGFVVGIAGAIGFATIFSLGPEQVGRGFTQALGVSLALGIGGMGIGLVTWAHGLMPDRPDVEEREFPAPDPNRRRAMLDALEARTGTIGRRSLLGRLFATALGATGLAALFPLRSLGPDPFPQRTRTGWFPGVRVVTVEGEPVAIDDLPVGGLLTVFPEGAVDRADSQVVLVRVSPDILKPRVGREDWSPEGHIAYSKLCTHAGCPVGLYQVESQRLLCPCHQSAFDVLDGARPIFGPAARDLPQLPLAVDGDGFLVAQRDFVTPVGSGFWTYPTVTDQQPDR